MFARSTVAVILGLLTGMVLGQLLTPPLSVQPNSSAQERSTESAARAFYDAANRYLELGDATMFADILHASFVDHSAIEPDGDAEGLVRYLAALRATYPDMRFDVAGMMPRDDLVAVSLATTGGTAAVARGLVADRPPSSPGFEQLRIANGKVAERWAGQTLPPQYELAASMELRHLSGWFVECAMVPLMLAPGASETRRQFSYSLLMSDAGSVALEIERRDSADPPLLMSGDAASPIELRRGARVDLANESVVLFPEGESYRIWNAGQQPASVIIVEIQYRSPGVTLHNGEYVGSGPKLDGDAIFPVGLVPMGTDADVAFVLSLVQVRAAPHETLPIHSVNGLEQLLVAEGAIEVELHAGNAVLYRIDGRAIAAPGDRRQLLPGEGTTAHSEALLSYRVTEDDPATIWFVTLVPTVPESD